MDELEKHTAPRHIRGPNGYDMKAKTRRISRFKTIKILCEGRDKYICTTPNTRKVLDYIKALRDLRSELDSSLEDDIKVYENFMESSQDDFENWNFKLKSHMLLSVGVDLFGMQMYGRQDRSKPTWPLSYFDYDKDCKVEVDKESESLIVTCADDKCKPGSLLWKYMQTLC